MMPNTDTSSPVVEAPMPKYFRIKQAVLARLRELDPEVVLYFSGSRQSVYQVNMWLPVLAALPQRSIVLLRERYLLEKLAPTEVPVVCMSSGISVMQASHQLLQGNFFWSDQFSRFFCANQGGIVQYGKKPFEIRQVLVRRLCL